MGFDKKNRRRTQAQSQSKKPSMRGKSGSDFFVLPHPLVMFAVSFGLYLLAQSTIRPSDIPGFLGPVGSFGHFMGTQYHNVCVFLCVFAAVAHSSEAAYAGKICHDRGMTTGATFKWVASTFCFGIFSLYKILYKQNNKTA